MNHECIYNKRNYKSITPQDHVNIFKFYKTLECKLCYLIHFLNDFCLMSQLVAISSEITFMICHVAHLMLGMWLEMWPMLDQCWTHNVLSCKPNYNLLGNSTWWLYDLARKSLVYYLRLLWIQVLTPSQIH